MPPSPDLLLQDQTPGGRDEAAVPEGQRLGGELEVGERVKALIACISQTLFGYVSQARWEGDAGGLACAVLCCAWLGGSWAPAC